MSDDDSLLAKFEAEKFPDDYKEYLKAKRGNFVEAIRVFPEMLECWFLLDKIILREAADLKTARDVNKMFPLILYLNAHAKMRIAMELAFCACMTEARSILRDAVESLAHGHRMFRDPALQPVWLKKNDDKNALDAFDQAFKHSKRLRLFDGLPDLLKQWNELSEAGAHTNIMSLCDRFKFIDTPENIEFRLSYCGVEEQTWIMSTFSMLLTCFIMELVMFTDFMDRLKLDYELLKLRTEFEQRKERFRKYIKRRYNIKLPSPTSP